MRARDPQLDPWRGDHGGPRNETYKHLEDPLRLSGLTLGQWAALCGSALAAIAFGLYVSPLPPRLTVCLSLFVAGLPVSVSYAVGGSDMAISQTLAAVYRWGRGAKHYLPGAGATRVGYVVSRPTDNDPRDDARAAEEVAAARRQLEEAWDL